jgi:hypothetical protein
MLHMPVRVGVPQFVTGLSDVVSNETLLLVRESKQAVKAADRAAKD